MQWRSGFVGRRTYHSPVSLEAVENLLVVPSLIVDPKFPESLSDSLDSGLNPDVIYHFGIAPQLSEQDFWTFASLGVLVSSVVGNEVKSPPIFPCVKGSYNIGILGV